MVVYVQPPAQDPNDGAMVPYTPQNAQVLQNRLQNHVPPSTLARVMDAFKIAGKLSLDLWRAAPYLFGACAAYGVYRGVCQAANAAIEGVTDTREAERAWQTQQQYPDSIVIRNDDGSYSQLRDGSDASHSRMMINTLWSMYDGETRSNIGAIDFSKITPAEFQAILDKRKDASDADKGLVQRVTGSVSAERLLQDFRDLQKKAQTELRDRVADREAEREKLCQQNPAACAIRWVGETAVAPWVDILRYGQGVYYGPGG